ncbi:hypothetical protein ACFL2E_08360 [Thermodesulfobacteriota bacterium]
MAENCGFNGKDLSSPSGTSGVEYVQEEAESKIQKERLLSEEINRESLRNIPEDLVSDMRKAIKGGDMDQLMKLIEQAAEHDKILVKKLRNLTEQYEYDALLKLL